MAPVNPGALRAGRGLVAPPPNWPPARHTSPVGAPWRLAGRSAAVTPPGGAQGAAGAWSVNAERRHLTLEQILAIEVALNGWEETEAARQKQVEAGKRFHKGSPKVETNRSQALSPPPAAPKAPRAPQVRKQIAAATGASEHKVQQAINVQKADPKLLQQVAHGTATLREAAKKVAAATPPPAKPAFAPVRLPRIR